MLKTSSTTKLSKNLLLSMDMAEIDEVGDVGSDRKDKTVKRLPSKNLNRAMNGPTPNARRAFTQLR